MSPPPSSPPRRTSRGLFVAPFDALADPVALADLATAAEDAGWDGFFVWDHLLYREPVREIADPWIALAAIAVRTRRVAIGPMVTPLSRRRPHVLARQAATLDQLCGGRLVLGFGLGDDWVGEFSRFGERDEAGVRAAMLDEGLDLLRALLSGAEVDHRGKHYTARGVRFLPAAQRVGGIPFWIAGRWPNAAPQRRAARYEGYFPISVPSPAELGPLREALLAAGADVAAGAAGAGGAGAWADARRYDLVVDLPAGQDPAPWAAAGATWVLTRLGPGGLDLEQARAVVAAGP